MQWLDSLDAWQQKHPLLAVPVAVIKKYNDNLGNDQAAILTYYGFLAIFPLLLALLSLLEVGLATHPEFRESIERSALSNFPILSDTLGRNIEVQSGTWFRVAVSILIAVMAGLGIANTLQRITADFWQVPAGQRRQFPKNILASLGLLLTGGSILIGTTIVAQWIATPATLHYHLLSFGINLGLFFVLFRLATPSSVAGSDLVAQTVLTACGWQTLQAAGDYLVRHQLSQLSPLYGSFATVLGLLFWLYLLARMVLYAIETDVVLARKQWPRSFIHNTPAKKHLPPR